MNGLFQRRDAEGAEERGEMFWSAVAERCGDTAFERIADLQTLECRSACESGVALCFPPQSINVAGSFAPSSLSVLCVSAYIPVS